MRQRTYVDSTLTFPAFDYGSQVFVAVATGRVHSVFAHGFNVAVGGRLVHVALDKASLHPHMVGLRAPGVFAVGSMPRVGDTVELDAAAKTLVGHSPAGLGVGGPWTIDCSRAFERRSVPLAASRLTPPQLDQLAATLERAKTTHADSWSFWQGKIQEHLAKFRQTGDPAALLPLIGFGPGLTPSGDDVLVGLLAALVGRGDLRAEALRQVIRANAGRTTDVSRDLLLAATEGHFGFALTELSNAAPDLAPAALDKLVAALLAWGSTSGLDTLQGLMYGMV